MQGEGGVGVGAVQTQPAARGAPHPAGAATGGAPLLAGAEGGPGAGVQTQTGDNGQTTGTNYNVILYVFKIYNIILSKNESPFPVI